ncbi:MAG: TM0106 family RecB-like putative nuclease, partial [Acidimicrobiales bacterium]
MYLDGDRLVVSPTDLVAHLHCQHLTELSLEVARGVRAKPPGDDPELEVLQRRGLEHEQAYLKQLNDAGTVVVEIEDGPFAQEVRRTLGALAERPDVIYQAAFFDDADEGTAWRGHADFLHRVEGESSPGDYSYDPSDTKLARHVRPGAVIQLCSYAAQLARLQGKDPEHVHVVLGGGKEPVTLRLADFAAYFRQAKRRFEAALGTGGRSYPLPNQHCPVCPWHEACEERWRRDDHLVTVAGLRLEQARRLEAAGIPTAGALAELPDDRIPGMVPSTLGKLRRQARLQRMTTADGRPAYELLETAADGVGLAALPVPSSGDLFFDIEGDPYVGPAGIEYLLGAGWDEERGAFGYLAFWAHDGAEEKRAFEAFIDFVTERRAADPDLHVYHFAAYEQTAVGRLMGRHGTREKEV